jgi:GNAT superfamily N-acetyltransferase
VYLSSIDNAASLDLIYEQVLQPSFPANELVTVEALRAGVASGLTRVHAAFDATDPVGVAVAEWSPATRVLLLAYLAVVPGRRSAGLGQLLLGHVTGPLREEFGARAVLTEIKHPAGHRGSEAYGDPMGRLRFYARNGGLALAVPYFQPALRRGSERVYGVILAALWLGPEGGGLDQDTADATMVRDYLAQYLHDTEGGIGDDEPTREEWAALDRTDGIPLMSLVDTEKIPVSHAHG